MKRILQVMVVALLLPLSTAWAQERTVTGKITSQEDGSGLPGVNVTLKGTTIGTVTDVSGNYSISVSGSSPVLVFSFIGLKTQEVQVGSRAVVDVQMAAGFLKWWLPVTVFRKSGPSPVPFLP
ncbi:MAG: carboxypeptidase-like regulatory domain-containing protein [Cyclobacteriaceae bacterium]|nr:carboxypeptidase-like regulatory domain-containing protein [Cyclobacteriaceae bacterium]